jgi:hypothetical protein
VDDLLQDDYFVTSAIRPTQDSEGFWMEAVRNGALDAYEYKLACYIIHSVQVRPERIEQQEVSGLWEDIEIANKGNLMRRKYRFHFYLSAVTGIVAVWAIVFGLSHLRDKSPVETSAYHIEDIKAPDTPVTDIQLVLADNQTLALEGKDAKIAYNEEGIEINDEKATVEKEPVDSDQPVTYNQLIVPKGKRSTLIFADGSRLWVNAGTRIVYPVTFDKKKREIYVDGEAFLDVSRNEDCPFLVKTKGFHVEVLGTSFNITAYEKDSMQSVVLVSGAVKINSAEEKETILTPNEMYTNVNGSPEVKTVDVEAYISWKSGLYKYESETLGVILTRLSRYYGQEISCSPQSAYLKCSGKLDLKDELAVVLNGIAQTAPVVCNYKEGKYLITNK